MLTDNQGFRFGAESVRAIEEVVRRVMSEDQGRRPDRAHFPKFVQGVELAKNGASSIAARSGTTPGSGTVTLYKCDSSTLEEKSESTKSITAYNLASAEVAADAYLMVARIGNKYWIMFEDCG